MKKYLFAASAVALIAASGAQAADVVRYQEPVAAAAQAPAFSWQGFYAGGQIGGSWARGKIKNETAGEKGTVWSSKPDGFIGGLYAGYNFDAGNNIILGLETDFVWGDVEDSRKNSAALPGENRLSVKQKWNGATRVRAGYAIDRFLPYIAGGVAYGQVKARGSYSTAASEASASLSDTYTGWTIGAGVDYAMTDNVLLRLEYRYTDLGDKKYNNVFDVAKTKIDYTSNDVRVGVAYKF